MLERIIAASIAHRWLMMSLTLALIAVGAWSFTKLPIDATPDITNVQVQINTAAPGYSPLEAEQRITYPVETVMAGLPRMEQARSLSRYGLSQVTVVFEDGTDIYFARQQVAERLHSNGIRAIAATMTPFGGSDRYEPVSAGTRTTLNTWMRGGRSGFDALIDFDQILRDPAKPEFLPEAITRDFLH
ncbi:efflux RND transporter permease subunit, partial [Pseudomonas sp. K8]|uniref:efflux RND transporter permease subunit n=1 Tax=Pseudomonas sp. K8 TaxID=212200 RepID=UPI001D018048